MAFPERSSRQPLDRADLPAELTSETLRGLSFQTLRRLADHHNGVLDAEEQRQFDTALREVMRGTASRVNEAVQRAPRGGPALRDPTLRRSYERTQQRLAEQTRRARERFPELALDHPDESTHEPEPSQPSQPSQPPVASEPSPSVGSSTGTPTVASSPVDDDVSPRTLAQEVEQTSETLDMLERIASLQEQQLKHQESQLLTETRGVFFAFLVSVAVIVAGIAPLVGAEPHERLLIVLWTVVVIGAAGLVYALVRRLQSPR